MAIMYRANAQSRSLEEALINTNQPYQLVGGTKFYERREIKDALAYLQALVNPDDDVNLRRILNVPKRGLGDRAEGVLLAYAREHGTSFFYALMHLDEIEVPTRTATSLRAFRDLMGALSQFTRAHDSKPSEIVAEVLEKSGLRAELEKSVDPQDASRLENLSQLQSTAAEFEQNTPDVVRIPGDHRACGRLRPTTRRGRGLRQGDAHDLAHRQGPRIPGGVPDRHGTGHLPAFAFDGRHH